MLTSHRLHTSLKLRTGILRYVGPHPRIPRHQPQPRRGYLLVLQIQMLMEAPQLASQQYFDTADGGDDDDDMNVDDTPEPVPQQAAASSIPARATASSSSSKPKPKPKSKSGYDAPPLQPQMATN